jgi:hypothetical protein
MKNLFTAHPHDIGETYFQHLFYALKFGSKMVIAGLACLTHAVFPFLFVKTGSNMLLKMTAEFQARMQSADQKNYEKTI